VFQKLSGVVVSAVLAAATAIVCAGCPPPTCVKEVGTKGCGCDGAGTILCDGSCSVPDAAKNHGQVCNACGGTYDCNGNCPLLGIYGQICNACGGTYDCNGNCPPDPSTLGQTCNACGGTYDCDGNCPPDPSWFGQACNACGGTYDCNGDCPAAPPHVGEQCGCDDDWGTIQCDGSCSKPCIRATFDWIDDDAYVWPSSVLGSCNFSAGSAIPGCQINTGSIPRSGWCDIRPADIGGASGQIIIKIGNGDCFNSHGNVHLLVNGNEVWTGIKGDTGTFTQCSWTYREVISLNLAYGGVQVLDDCYNDHNGVCCYNAGDCSC
jgi:hypothetical protein